MTLHIHWHWYGRNKHALVKMDGTEFVQATPIGKLAAEMLIEIADFNSGS